MRSFNLKSIRMLYVSTVLACTLAVLMYTFAAVLYSASASAQDAEFRLHENGLIYDEETMIRLERIVDSLNLKFKMCEPKHYQSLPQGFATFVTLKENAQEARLAMDTGMSLESFLVQFRPTRRVRQWIFKSYYKNYRNEEIVEYSMLPLRDDSQFRVRLPYTQANDRTIGWIYEEKNGELYGFYLEDVRPLMIPQEYSQLIQYVDCLIDTTAQIYLSDKTVRGMPNLPPDSKIEQYLKIAENFKGQPKVPKIDWDNPSAQAKLDKFMREYQQWENKRLAWLDEKMNTDDFYKNLLIEAAKEAIEQETGDPRLEFYVERYLSSGQALAMKRLRRPVGSCSRDQTPRLHAQNICRLAAKTTQWDIFLRAHLDIMNDNFERVTDGSYAWSGRGTYLRELEELNINTFDLLIGTSLRASNVSDNHYFGDIGRVGRALSEASSKDELEQRVLHMIEDEKLDIFNRLLMAYLFDNYNHHVQDHVRKKDNDTRFMDAVLTLPNDIGKTFTR